jgi:hypothetical protein
MKETAMPTLPTLLLIGGALHFAILIASFLTPYVLDWRRALASLTPFLRTLFWVYGAFVVLTIIGMGSIAVLNAETLSNGSMLARCVCGFIALFWLSRLFVQFFVFDIGPVVTQTILKAGYHALTFVFAYLAAVFGAAALWA